MRISAVALLLAAGVVARVAAAPAEDRVAARIKEIETRLGGRVGVAALEAGRGKRIEYRADERFPMCSTFKLPLAAAVLHRVETGAEQLERVVPYTDADILPHAPVAKEHLSSGGMTVEALSDAIIRYSDNTAANLLLDTLGGPAGLTEYVRSLGDSVTRLDRKEEELNTATPGDERDTTSPAAMLRTMQALLLGDALKPESRAKLEGWLVGNTTGGALIRAGAPAGWRIGDKTGRGAHGTTNDIAILRRERGAPILLCVYTTGCTAPGPEREAAIAEIARIVTEELATGGR